MAFAIKKKFANAPIGAGGALADGDYGDITVGGSGTTLTIDNDAVTFAKMQNISTSRILGRKTASSGDIEELKLSEVLDLIGSAAQGDILYRGASAWVRLGAGTSGQFLKTNGASANPSWATPGASLGGIVPLEYTHRSWVHQADVDALAYESALLPGVMSAVGGAGGSANDNDNDGRWIRNATGASSGNTVHLQMITNNIQRRALQSIYVTRIKTYTDISSSRWWAGFFSNAPEGSDDPTGHLAAFRYSTGAGDSNWMACVKDGTTLNAQSTGVAPATDTVYVFRIETDSSEVRFYINGTLVYTHTSNLPAVNTSMGSSVGVTTLTGSARQFKYARQQGWFLG